MGSVPARSVLEDEASGLASGFVKTCDFVIRIGEDGNAASVGFVPEATE